MIHVRGFVMCDMCGMCDMCVFECQSVLNSNKRGHAAGVTTTFIVMVAGSASIFDVVSFRFLQSYHLSVASMTFYSAHVSVDPTVVVRVTLD